MPHSAQIDPFTVHGGRIDLARACFPAAADWIDLSTGLAPWAYPARCDADTLARLPAPSALIEMEDAAAMALGIAPERRAQLVAVPGSDIGLRLLGRLIGGRAATVQPGYSGHVAMWQGRDAVAIGADALETAADSADTIILARPGNPDGRMVERDRLKAVAARLAARGGHLIIDEAFVDATPGDSLIAADWPGMIVLRSFGKFFGLAGLRLGFVLGPPPIAAALRAMIGDWPLSGPAIATGRAAYADSDWQAAQRGRIADAGRWIDGALAEAGLNIVGGTALFRLIETPARDALFAHFAAHAILTRPFVDAPQRLRIGLPGDTQGRARFAATLDQWRR